MVYDVMIVLLCHSDKTMDSMNYGLDKFYHCQTCTAMSGRPSQECRNYIEGNYLIQSHILMSTTRIMLETQKNPKNPKKPKESIKIIDKNQDLPLIYTQHLVIAKHILVEDNCARIKRQVAPCTYFAHCTCARPCPVTIVRIRQLKLT